MQRRASITAGMLAGALLERKLVTQLDLVGLLGSARHRPSLNTLEMALRRENVLSQADLLGLKGELSGRPVLSDDRVAVLDTLHPAVASRHGALVVDRTPLTVVFVEDTPANVDAVAAALGTSAFEVWLITSPQFVELRASAYSDAARDHRPPVPDLFTVLDEADQQRATDVHLKVGCPPRLRVDGRLVTLAYQPVDRQWIRAQVERIAEPRHLAELDRSLSTDLAYTFGSARYRVNVAHDTHGATMALRKLPSAIPEPADLNLPDTVSGFANLERGLVLVTGPTGSGKSTTLAAVLHLIVRDQFRHVITLEDPIEFRFPINATSLVNQRELGQSFLSFAEGLRDALRQDPDVILVGELRDAETIRTALTAAETGHLVLATLHTFDAAGTIMRLVNSFPTDEQDAVRAQLSQLLKGVVSQTLLPRASGGGRVAAFEVLVNTPAIGANLRKLDGHHQIKQTMQTSSKDGMTTMEASLAKLVISGHVTRAEAEFRARDGAEFTRALDYFATALQRARQPGAM